MKLLRASLLLLVLPVVMAGCQVKDDAGGGSPGDGPAAIPAPDDVAEPPADAIVTASGLAYKVLTVGLGSVRPKPQQRARVHYTGWTTDGKMFESSYLTGKPPEFQVAGVIPGWTEMLQLMVVGQKVRAWIPAKLAYEGSPSRPQGMLVFEIELLDIR